MGDKAGWCFILKRDVGQLVVAARPRRACGLGAAVVSVRRGPPFDNAWPVKG